MHIIKGFLVTLLSIFITLYSTYVFPEHNSTNTTQKVTCCKIKEKPSKNCKHCSKKHSCCNSNCSVISCCSNVLFFNSSPFEIDLAFFDTNSKITNSYLINYSYLFQFYIYKPPINSTIV